MSCCGKPNFTNLPQEDNMGPKKLADSRWAPGGIEDQMMDIDEASNQNMPTPTTNGLASSRWAADPTGPNQAGNKKPTKPDQKSEKNNHQMKAPNSILNQPRPKIKYNRGTRGTRGTTTPATTRRIIGPLSAEEQEVKMENPFFDPTKHKGLGSSRWANE